MTHKLGKEPDHKRRLLVARLYVEEGLSCAAIGRELGISRQAVWQMLKRSGIELRGRSGGGGKSR